MSTPNFSDMFYTRLIDFVDDLLTICPNMSELKLFKKGLQLEMPLTKKDVIKIFRENVVAPYGQKIEARDEVFFLDTADYSTVTTEFDLIQKIKNIWKNLDDDNKEAVWKHLNLLVKLNTRC